MTDPEALLPLAEASVRGKAHGDALARCGVDAPDLFGSTLGRLLAALRFHDDAAVFTAVQALGAARPDAAVEHLATWLDTEAARGLALDPARAGRLLRVFGNADYLARRVARQPELARVIAEPGALPPRDPAALAEAAGAFAGDPARELRRLRYAEMLRITARDLEGAPLSETASELSDLADACIEAAVATAVTELGTERAPGVVAMGKLGGRELNYSSDVDLIFVHEPPDELAEHAVQTMERVVKRSRALLHDATADGFAFRVDLDLRPEGRAGALVNSLASLLTWYETFGEEWERLAWIRARGCAGDRALVKRLLRELRPFVYPRAVSYDVIQSVHHLKGRIEQEARNAPRDVKRGPGGIRETEFFVQALQSLYGGHRTSLRVTRTADALAALAAEGLLPESLAGDLVESYAFLRQVEHRLQMAEDRQTQQIPADGRELERLARRMGYASPDARRAASDLLRDLDRVRGGVRHAFESLLAEPDRGTGRAPSAWSEACRSPRGFTDALLHTLPETLRERARPPIERVVASAFPRASGAITALGQTPGAAAVLARFLCCDPPLVAHLARRPQLLSAFAAGAPPPGVDRETLARGGLEDVESSLDELRLARQDASVRVAAAHLAGQVDTAGTERLLSETAEALLERALGLARHQVEKRTGAPLAEGARIPLCVVGLGSFGAREMTYQSDLDLVFVYATEGRTEGGRDPMGAQEHFALLAQRLISYLVTPTGAGRVYTIDTRLRPSGHGGTLVVSADAFRRYHEKEAMVWEAQSLLRARPVAGDPDFAGEVASLIEHSLFDRPVRPGLEREILRMRTRLETEMAQDEKTRIDLKYAAGGLVDAEFLAQFLALRWGAERPELRRGATAAVLEAAGRVGLLPDTEALLEAFWCLDRIAAWLRLATGRAESALDRASPSTSLVALLEGVPDVDALAERVYAARRRLRAGWQQVFGPASGAQRR